MIFGSKIPYQRFGFSLLFPWKWSCSFLSGNLSQRKYVFDLLSEIRLLSAHLVKTPMDSTVKLDCERSELFTNVADTEV